MKKNKMLLQGLLYSLYSHDNKGKECELSIIPSGKFKSSWLLTNHIFNSNNSFDPRTNY
jgi:hypothetical protein